MNRLTSIIQRALTALLVGSACNAGDPAPVPSTAKPPAAAKTTITHVDAAGAAKLLTDKQVVVLDVRTPGEFAAGHIRGATNIDFQAKEFSQRLGALDKSGTYLVHCASGGRSTRSIEVLQRLGFQQVVHLDGGFNAWKKADQPVAK